MGWLSWNTFGCEIDCKNKPTECLDENQITTIADRMVNDGYMRVGYKFVIIDDCWMAKERDSSGRLQPDPDRFSKGMNWLADYMHDRKLKFGLYEDYGQMTCARYPGSIGHAEIDAQTFASWGVDYVKLDGCYASIDELDKGYPEFGKALNKTGRPIVYSTEWPLYSLGTKAPNYTAVRETCNLWRNYEDIHDNWDSLISVIDYMDAHQEELIAAAGPGGWNDPDMLLVGNAGITEDQAKLQMALWAIWSAPLIISTDLRNIKDPFKEILQNEAVISVNQDPLGIHGRLVIKTPNVSVYVKPMTPVDKKTGDRSHAIAFLNRNTKTSANFTVQKLAQLGLNHEKGYVFEDLFENSVIVSLGPEDSFETTIKPTGITMFKATVVT